MLTLFSNLESHSLFEGKVWLLNINQEQNRKDYYTRLKVQSIQVNNSSTGQLEIWDRI